MGQRLTIEIETTQRGLETEIFETSNPSAHDLSLTLSDGSVIAFRETLIRKSFETSEVIKFTAELAGAVGTNIFASCLLYDKIKGKPAKLRINRKEVEITPDRIRIVIEEIEKEG